MILPTTTLEIALEVWRSLLNQPYSWGGDDPVHGFDCSGLILEGLKAAGVFPREGDATAAQLASRFPRVSLDSLAHLQPDCLLFWNRGSGIGHVEAVYVRLGGTVYTIGASGGGSATTNEDAAAAQNAYVKLRPAVANWVAAVDPFHERRGV